MGSRYLKKLPLRIERFVLELGALGLLESVCSPIGSVQDVLEICLIGHSLESLADGSRK